VPEAFARKLAQKDSPEWQFQVGVEHAAGQLVRLADEGVPGIHFYVLNRSRAALAVMQAIEHLNLPR